MRMFSEIWLNQTRFQDLEEMILAVVQHLHKIVIH